MTEQTNTNSAPDATEYDLTGMRVVLSSQTFGPVDPDCSKSIRLACMYAGNRGLTWVADTSANRMSYGGARNYAAKNTLESPDNPDGLMWIDSDIQPEPRDIARLLATAHRNNYDFCSGVYHQRDGDDYFPVFYTWGVGDDGTEGFQLASSYKPDTIYEVAGCGFGFCYTSVKLLKDVMRHPDYREEKGQWFPDKRDIKGGRGEDLSFCYMAMQMGYSCFVDTGVIVGHTADAKVIGKEEFLQRQHEKALEMQIKWRRDNL